MTTSFNNFTVTSEKCQVLLNTTVLFRLALAPVGVQQELWVIQNILRFLQRDILSFCIAHTVSKLSSGGRQMPLFLFYTNDGNRRVFSAAILQVLQLSDLTLSWKKLNLAIFTHASIIHLMVI